MSTIAINAQLALLAALNCYSNNHFTIELTELPAADAIEDSLKSAFGSGMNYQTKKSYSAEDWHLRADPKGADVKGALAAVIREWVFAMGEFPSKYSKREYVKDNVVSLVCEELEKTVGLCQVFEVFVSPPCWYEAHWRDFAFKGSEKSWLLHFGVTD